MALTRALVTACILLLPLVAMQFTDEVVWDLADFVVAGVLLFGAGLTYELVARRARKAGNTAYRAAVGVAVATALILVWMNLAVGIIGNEENPANLMYGGVLAVGIIGALIARFQPQGMARALFATALAQMLVAVIALITGWGSTGPIWPRVGLAVSESGGWGGRAGSGIAPRRTRTTRSTASLPAKHRPPRLKPDR